MAAPITTAVTICNSALLKVGADVISSLTQTTRAAVACNALYAYIRDEVMGSSPWRFAKTRVILAPTDIKPIFEYLYTYTIPSDCLRPLMPENDAIPWAVENGMIFTNYPELRLHYIFRNTDESSWDARFCEAVAWRLAMELSLTLAQSIPMHQAAAAAYKDALAQARAMNGIQGTPLPLEADIWSLARKGYRWWRPSQGQGGDDPNYG